MKKPEPSVSAETKAYWEAAAAGRLLYQHCVACNTAQYYPRSICSNCGEQRLEWRESEGRGTIHAITRVHVGLPSFKEDAPYAIALVTLEEGVRMLTNLLGDNSCVNIGDAVKLAFENRGKLQLPQFTLADS